jgi:hypothetical protein
MHGNPRPCNLWFNKQKKKTRKVRLRQIYGYEKSAKVEKELKQTGKIKYIRSGVIRKIVVTLGEIGTAFLVPCQNTSSCSKKVVAKQSS